MMYRLLLLLCLLPSVTYAEIIDRIVAVVNDEVITLTELEDTTKPLMEQVARIADPVARDAQRQNQLQMGLDALIGKRLMSQEAAQRNIAISKADVDQHLSRIRGSRGWTEEQLRIYLTGQGMSLGQFREETRAKLLQQRIVGIVLGQKVRVSDRDLEDYYKEKVTRAAADYVVEAAHILLRVPADATAAQDAATRQEMEELILRARSGESFATLAAQYSQGPGAAGGGKLGRVRRGSIDPTLEKAIFDLKAGDVGGPVRSRFGYHAVHAVAQHAVAAPPLDKVREQLRGELYNKRLEGELKKWIDELKAKAFIEIRL